MEGRVFGGRVQLDTAYRPNRGGIDGYRHVVERRARSWVIRMSKVPKIARGGGGGTCRKSQNTVTGNERTHKRHEDGACSTSFHSRESASGAARDSRSS